MYRRKESRIDIKLEILIWFKEWAKAAADKIIALIDNIQEERSVRFTRIVPKCKEPIKI